MENNQSVTRIIEYLYGELTQKEKEAFEEEVKNNAELRREVESLLEMKNGLSRLRDQEIMEPFLFQAHLGKSFWQKSRPRPLGVTLRYVAVVAASLLLLLVAGFLTRASLDFQNHSMTLRFGSQPDPAENTLTRDEVYGMISQQLDASHRQWTGELKNYETEFTRTLAEHNKKQKEDIKNLFAGYSDQNSEQLERFIVQLQENNREVINDYFIRANSQQQQNMQSMLATFADYLERKRQQDLEKIQNSLVTLKESQAIQKLETSQILTSIITTMNTQNN
jgi:hypothetical protein